MFLILDEGKETILDKSVVNVLYNNSIWFNIISI